MTPRIYVSGSIVVVGLYTLSALGCSAEASDPYPPSDKSGNTSGGSGSAGSGGAINTPAGGKGGSTSNAGTGGAGNAGGTAAGSGGSAGSASGGATSGCTPQVGAATDLVIANVDATMSNAINMPRVGYWYTFADAAASVTPVPATTFMPATTGGANATAFYAGLTGSGGKYAGLGFALNDGGAGNVCTYDVSAYTGISFYYKSSHLMRVALATAATTAAPKGTCAAMCDNHHGKKATMVAADWTLFSAKWTELSQDFGTLSAFDKTKVLQIQFQLEGVWNATDEVTDPIVGEYLLAVDEVTFTTD